MRVAHTDSRGEQEQYWIADRALERYMNYAAWEGQTGTEADILHARIDRLGAYQARNRHTDVIDEYESLQEQGIWYPLMPSAGSPALTYQIVAGYGLPYP